jgi:transcription termination factor NusB
MASRYEQREVVIQTLFESDFYNELNLTFAQDVLLRNCREFLLLEEVPEFARNLLAGTILKREVIDQIVGKAAPE